MGSSHLFIYKKIGPLLCSSAFFWAASCTVSFAEKPFDPPSVEKKEEPPVDTKEGKSAEQENAKEEDDDDDGDDYDDDGIEEDYTASWSQERNEGSVTLSPEAYLESLNKAQTKGTVANTQQLSPPPVSDPNTSQDHERKPGERSNAIGHSTDEDGRITTTYHSGFRPESQVQTQPQYVDLGSNNRPMFRGDSDDWHPPKPWPPKPDKPDDKPGE